MHPSIMQRALPERLVRAARSIRLLRLPLVALAALTLAGCVPYVKYEDAITKLNRANQVNQDLERTLRDAQIGESSSGGDLRAANARIESLETQNEALRRELDLLEQEKLALIEKLGQLPPINVDNVPQQFEVNPDTQGIILPGDVLFASGKATLRNEAKAVIDQLIGLIQRDYPNHIVFVDGHTDNTPIDKSAKVNKDNWDLGAKRAHAVFEYMNEKGITDERMVLTSRGFAQPVSNVDPSTKDGRSKCRRVEIRLKPTSY